MLFSSSFFLFAFFPIYLLYSIYFAFAKTKFINHILLFICISFYSWGEPVFCLIALASAGLDYCLCNQIYRLRDCQKSKYYVAIGIVINLAILIYYKYTNFFLNSISQLIFSHDVNFLDIALPIGVSFIVFEKITYLVDVHRGICKPANSILNYLLYIFFFPKLLAGPIIKYHEIEDQLNEREFNADDMAEGFKRFLVGLAKKVLIADTCGQVANEIFKHATPQFGMAWIGILSFTLQIYFDFSGYSDMALGLARMLGFKLKENFNMPYIATSFTDFWRRWHISLSTWIKEYLYVPLGGNRVSQTRKYVNLWICFILSGLWHGANWTFVVWGAYNGLFLVLDKLFWLKISAALPRVIRVSITMLLVMMGWVIFRSQDLHRMVLYLNSLIHPHSRGHAYIDITLDSVTSIVFGFMIVLMPLIPSYESLLANYHAWKWRTPVEGVLVSCLGALAIAKVVAVTYTPFLYFKF